MKQNNEFLENLKVNKDDCTIYRIEFVNIENVRGALTEQQIDGLPEISTLKKYYQMIGR